MYLELKNNHCAIKTSNNFGDQIIAILDLSKDDEVKDHDFKHYAGKVIYKEINQEGDWLPFTATRLNKILEKRGEK